MARGKKVSFRWSRRVVSTEGSPIVVADLETFHARAGSVEGAGDDVDIDEGAVLLDTNGGGPVDVGVSDDEVIVLLASSDFDDDPKSFAKLLKAIESERYPEYLVGTIEPKGDLVVDDAANGRASGSKPAFLLPWKAGRYTVVEGHYDEEHGEARWCRIMLPGRREYAKRPAETPRDPVEEILERVSFVGPKEEARSLEAALELIALGRADLALEIAGKASAARRALATWTRVLALASQKNDAAVREATALAEEWLRPADRAEHPSQVLPRSHVLRALDVAGAGADLRVRVAGAPEPDVFVADTGGDFF